MRKLLALVLLAACELQPPPPKQEPPPAQPPPPTPAAPADAEVAPPPAAPADAGAPTGEPPKVVISAPCIEVGAKVAQVFIDSAVDPAQKSIYEQERANMTRKTGEACTAQAWSEAARKCYLATKTPAEIKACEKKFPAPPTPAKPPKEPVAPVPGAGSAGSGMRPEPRAPRQ